MICSPTSWCKWPILTLKWLDCKGCVIYQPAIKEHKGHGPPLSVPISQGFQCSINFVRLWAIGLAYVQRNTIKATWSQSFARFIYSSTLCKKSVQLGK